MSRPITFALGFIAECIVDLAALGIFLAAALFWAGVVAVPL